MAGRYRLCPAAPAVRGLIVVLLAAEARAQEGAPAEEQAPPTPAPAEEELVSPRLVEPFVIEPPAGGEPLPPGSSVELLLTLDAEGRVRAVEIATPLRADVDALALESAWRLRFEPARQGTRAIPAQVKLRLNVVPAAEAAATPEPGVPDEPVAEAPPEREAPAAESPAYESVVRGTGIEPGAASRVVLQGAELTTVPGTFGEPLRVVATLPGVVRSPFGLGYFLVRGASFENTGFFVDGFQVPILYHLVGGPAVLSSRLVGQLDFYPGGYPASYGRFSAGIVALQTAPPPTDRLHLEAEVDLFRAGALAVVPVQEGRGTVAVAFRRSYYEFLLPLVVEGIDLSYSDYQLRADYRLTPRLSAAVFVFGSDDQLDIEQTGPSGEVTTSTQTGLAYSFVRAIGSLRWRLPGGTALTWSGMAGVDSTMFRSREPARDEIRIAIKGAYLAERFEAAFPAVGPLRPTVGLDLSSTQYAVDSSLPTPLGLGEFPKPDFDPQVVGLESNLVLLGAAAYVQPVLEVGPVELTPALRLELFRYGEVTTVVPDPRAVVRVRTTPSLTLKASTGLFAQPPSPLQLDQSLGTPSLRPLRSWQSSVGAEVKLPLAIEFEPTLFYSQMSRLPRVSGETVEEDGRVQREIFADDGRGRAYGLEVLVRRRIERGLYGWVSYTLSRSERYLTGGQVVPFDFDQTHTLSIATSYQLGPWRFGARFTLSTGRPDEEIVGAVYDADADRYRPEERPGLTLRLPTYHQLDLRIDREWEAGPLRGTVFVDVINVYNAENSEGRDFQFDFARSTNVPGIPILPTIGVRVELE